MKDELYEKDNRNIWHPLKPYQKGQKALIAKQAKGAWVTDIEGETYLDGMSGLWCVNVGYGREELAEAAARQLRELSYMALTNSHVPAIELSEKLNEWLGGNYRYLFSNSGSEANETAFKVARQYHAQTGQPEKYKIISRYRSYHGSTFAAMAATGQAQRKYKYEPLPPGFIHVKAPEEYRRPAEYSFEQWSIACADMMEESIMMERPETVAAIIMEPLITGGGILIPHESYLKKIEEICKRHNVLLIIDEVICGFGRTGKNFGFHHYGIQPDIITLAKGMTSGYLPLSASAVRPEIYEAFRDEDESGHLRHVNTFGGNPAACSLALKNLEIMEKEKLVEQSRKLGDRIRKEFNQLMTHPYVGHIRHKGLLFGIELVKDKVSKEPIDASIVGEVVATCKEKGLIVGKNGDTISGLTNIITLAPPLSITEDDVTFIVTTLREVLAKVK
ncbi:aspartate aminotransferase family protein [Salsuginibacillus kocurii]|uniref:aspartate aminotransferase family protein n=1 Tax=Salsuginibacillus kocurii TaxID=427078 RepID=UPI00036E1F55|nr:aspartate aminotransferase family protein [Salsuginibacillus kocurii]